MTTPPTLSIVDHRLALSDGSSLYDYGATRFELEQHAATWSPALTDPVAIVIHYAVTDNLDATVRAQRARGYFAHLSIDGFYDGARVGGTRRLQVAQLLPFNRRGKHAGRSTLHGLPSMNTHAIGVEIANPGPLIRHADGKLRTVYKREWLEDDAVETGRLTGYPRTWTHWAPYTHEELAILAVVCGTMINAYPSIRHIVGHQHVSPGRKFDPGPAFPWDAMADLFEPRGIEVARRHDLDLTTSRA